MADDPDNLKQRIVELQLEHRGLDRMIVDAGQARKLNELEMRRLKKRKLQIKDAISALQMRLVPDIPA